jgi:hypothetical protein
MFGIIAIGVDYVLEAHRFVLQKLRSTRTPKSLKENTSFGSRPRL